ncbi:Phosphomevalonate kinase [Dothidotthia symphoricarpi CBS 119687]|uniref:Phosphomevalonate kinase n=1 Tax=Dothidotthia symphoricarpi CBS 119687 TaxID=1392245 RepID=A0A6A6AKT8_9PLEO|nr:Phosphomevalonate kinase [Dothidotthia symphoricarpi CBS 119687]KAF2131705.1 Phosphomevalonate kinase [Dothidotthia symphoricarpi CBS 119687]
MSPTSNASASEGPLTSTAVSCPAKVLVAGGYLVLDREYTGLVFGLDARIHVAVEPVSTRSGVTISGIVVKSPQFRDAIWEYGYRSQEADAGIRVTHGHEQRISKNPFIETALIYALTYIGTLLPKKRIESSSIRILADQAYYSNPGAPRTPTSPGRFLDFNVQLRDAHKTGLGSSAALVTSFTAAVLSFYLPKTLFDLQSETGLRILHNLAQASHSYAQGKVGSGFDIASAVYGSCLYKRFSPQLLSSLPLPGSVGFASKLRALIEGDAWDTQIQKAAIKMPQGLRLVMCDVDCGSETPSMVKQVLAWRASNKEEAEQIWQDLQAGNEALAAELTRLATADQASGGGSEKYAKLGEIINNNRKLIRRMGLASRVPIEPPQQTQLLDYCSNLDGVIGGVVPGAGGFDAVVLLVEDKEEVIAWLKQSLSNYKVENDAADGSKIGKVGILGIREEMVGVKTEEQSLYNEWTTAS